MRLIHGDCLDVLRTLPDSSVDSVVTDPPSSIGFMGLKWDSDRGGRDAWIAWLAERLAECYRVLKPGAHIIVWALPKTSGWTHRAIEDAGFEHRHGLAALHGQGFPKNLDVAKAVENAGGNGADYAGLGTALKPSWEMWYLARKQLDSTVAGSVTRWGTGALNIAATRVATDWETDPTRRGWQGRKAPDNGMWGAGTIRADFSQPHAAGRWPADVVLSHSPECGDQWEDPDIPGLRHRGVCSPGCPVAELDKQSGTQRSGTASPLSHGFRSEYVGGDLRHAPHAEPIGFGDSGGCSRFFPTFRYQAKPSTREKSNGLDDRNHHPTCKSSELMRWLCRLVTPPGGVILDPFAGSGTTGVAAVLEGFDCILIEAEAEYLPLIEGRVRWAERQVEQTAPTLFTEEVG